MRIKKIVATLASFGLIASPLAYATDGYFSDGYGMKSIGMAGVGIALPQDAIAAANNPAGMVMVGDRIDMGISLFRPDRSAEVSGSPGFKNGTFDGNGRANFLIPEFGYNKMVNNNTSLGVSVYGNGGMNTQYNNNMFNGAGPAGINMSQLFIAPTWSMKLNPSNSIGVSLNLVYQTFSATGLQAFQPSSSNQAAVTNNGTDTSTGVGVKLGWIGEVTSAITLGAAYQPKTSMSKLSKYSGLFAEQGGFDIPANYGVGIAVKAAPATTVAFDVKQIKYSGVASVANTVSQGGPLGANNGMGFGWQDMTVLKIGVSQAVSSTLTLRAGFSHNNQQIPASQTMFNILAPGVVQDHLTLGATFVRPDKSEITVGYMHAFKKTVNGPNSMAAFGGGSANLTMSEDSIGIAYGW
ncbi:hypothetical protein MIZ01_1485 [Sideroxyarcus emersonii]|uniref:Long-chain fatty acid transporter n=1 Tax=Sideroxyarcus emersonii TaxID=2764705 RepID=A0AAN1XAE8_9PROT|nr:outer membrane protein transport protein [Sideroxyarcus emersonii]BCK87694.1 hypothetical protein MIZ01_1485 [Sideroxyarcus emersonii]